MQVVKNKQLVENTWVYLPEAEALVVNGDVVVSLARWQQERPQLLSHNGKCGIRLVPSDTLEGMVGDLSYFDLVELSFPELADGRLFSLAWLLRGRYGYKGEIRAVGSYLPEQVFYLSRVGVDAFVPNREVDIHAILAGLQDFSVAYQTSIN
jgi:uncharacterized protein (DUF934 family)